MCVDLEFFFFSKSLLEIEMKYSILQRWLTSDKEYQDCQEPILFSKKKITATYLESWSEENGFTQAKK